MLDFITDLPIRKSFDSILIIIVRLTKMEHFITILKNILKNISWKKTKIMSIVTMSFQMILLQIEDLNSFPNVGKSYLKYYT
jgi:hypothetical protein